eukprot:COSAG06_NODE_42948_length_376_cov_11.462094_1_plen_125_part_11
MAVFAEWADAIGYEVVERRRADELAVLKEDLRLAQGLADHVDGILVELASLRSDVERAQQSARTAEACMHARTLMSAGQKRKQRCVVKSFNAWRSYTDRKAVLCMKLAKVVRRAQNMTVSCALLG